MISSPAQDALSAIGIEAVLEMIEDGQSQAEIARAVNCNVSQVNRWLHSDPQWSARARLAMLASAEALADRGHQALVEAAPDQAEIARARALEQHWRWRAAIRNPQYRDKVEHEHAGTVLHRPAAELSRAELVEIVQQSRLEAPRQQIDPPLPAINGSHPEC